MKIWYHSFLFLLVTLASLGVFTGCGGGGNDAIAATGPNTITFTFTWPATASGVVDLSTANSLKIVLHDEAGNIVGNGLIKRPANSESQASSLPLANLPTGRIFYTATAYSSANATGSPLATVTGAKTLTTATGTVTLGTGAVNHIMFNNRAINLSAHATYQLSVVAMTETHEILLLPTNVTYSYQSDNLEVASVSSQGLITGHASGTANIIASATIGGQTFETMNPAVVTVQ